MLIPVRAVLAALLALCVVSQAHAAEAWQEYGKLINNRQAVGALGPTLFGDQVDLATGGLSFSTTDVSIPGNSALPVAVSRTFAVKTKAGFPHPTATVDDLHFGDWELDLPHIAGVYSTTTGWINPAFGKSLQRCSVANTGEGAAPSVSVGVASFAGSTYWHGNRINIPGKGSRAMLVARVGGAKPITGGPYYWITSDWTSMSCLGTIQNGTGEGFLAITADGTKYWFNRMGANDEGRLGQKNASGDYDELFRKRYGLYATRVEDRFGNWVTYTYNNLSSAPIRLTNIDSSDGRHITLTYLNDRVSSVFDGDQTWTYQYAGTSLTTVILPDSSQWSIDFDQLGGVLGYLTGEQGEQWRDCNNPGDLRAPVGSRSGTITHPSGAIGEFALGDVRFRRNNVPVQCASGDPNTTNDDVSWYPNVWDGLALIQKRVTGPGLPTAEWNYTYDHESAGTTTVVGPGTYAQYTFGKTFHLDEGKLLSSVFGSSATDIRKTETSTYQLALSGQPYLTPIGYGPQVRGDDFTEEYLRPQLSHAITLQGVTFNWQVNSADFDAYARPLKVTRSSTLSYSRTETIKYFDDLTRWVLGQVEKTTCTLPASCAGQVITQTEYDGSSLPWKRSSFGKLQQTLTYNLTPGLEAGTLATVKDGNNNVTTLSSWKRGIPRLIRHPATAETPSGALRSASVDDWGRITSVVDENGHSTGYGYDVMGRLASIVYPTDDSVEWNTTTLTFVKVTGIEYGIATGHWKQTVSTGDARKITYFDGLWRPLVTEAFDFANPSGTRSLSVSRYDAAGHPQFQSYPISTLTDYATVALGSRTTYDSLDRVIQVQQDSEGGGVLNTSTAYLSGFQTQITNPRNKVTTITGYRAYDTPTTDWPQAVSHPEGAYTDIVRDPYGKPTSVTRRNAAGTIGLIRSYVYDTKQQLCMTVEPETGSTVVDYDAANNLLWSASGLAIAATTTCTTARATAYSSGRRVNRTYDPRNRVATLRFPDQLGDTDWTYTPDSLPASITAWSANGAQVVPIVTAYHYNKRRLLDGQGETLTQPDWYTWGIGYGYDGDANLSVHTYPSGLTVAYGPNALGQASKVTGQVGAGPITTYASGAAYFPNGAIKQFTYGNGIVHTLIQNTRQLPERSKDIYGASPAVLDDSYDFDANGNVAAISDATTGNRGDRDMSYDGLDRLLTTSSPMFNGTVATYTYDVLDNLKTVKAPGRDHTYVYDAANRLTNVTNTVGGQSVIGLGYDLQGNLANKNGQVYAFDYGNRLRRVVGQETYRYDALGRRVLAYSPTLGNILSQYSQSGQLVFQQNARTDKQTDYLYLAGSQVGQREVTITTGVVANKFVHTDALGSPVAVTNGSRVVLERSEYEPYGKVINSTPKDGPGYTGHVYDAVTGLNYMQQRYYDPGIGRFLSVDPVTADGNTGGNFNRYWYGNNNPYKFTDPDGRYGFDRHSRQFKIPGNSFVDLQRLAKSSDDDDYKQISTGRKRAGSGSVGRIKNPNHTAKPVPIDRRRWSIHTEISEGTNAAVDSKGGIIVQPRSIAWPPTNQFGFYVTQRPLDADGSLQDIHATAEWSKPVFYSSGFTGGSKDRGLQFDSLAGPGGNRWYVNYPSQAGSHDNSNAASLIILVPYR